MLPPEGSPHPIDPPTKSYAVWVGAVESEEEARLAVESVLANAEVPGTVLQVRVIE